MVVKSSCMAVSRKSTEGTPIMPQPCSRPSAPQPCATWRQRLGLPSPRSPAANYRGSCHCGTIAYEVEGDLDQVIQCNCSLCSRRGWLLWFVPRDRLALKTPASAMHTTFNTHRLQHHFCPTCGCAPFSEGIGPDGQAMAAVNARCLEDIDANALPVQHYDGRNA